MAKTYLYVRVSTEKQDYDRQMSIMKLNGYNEENSIVLSETFSGKTKKRPILNEILRIIEKDDCLVVTDLTRLARSVRDLWEITDYLTQKGALFVSIKENLDLNTSSGKLLFSIIGAVGQFERDIISERTKEGLKAKSDSGVILGRPKIIENVDKAINEVLNGMSVKEACQEFNIKQSTLYYYLKRLRDYTINKKGE